MLGRVDRTSLDVTEVYRFPNEPRRLADGLHWDADGLHAHIVEGIRRGRDAAPDLASIGIDSWAVDFGLIDDAGRLVYPPFHYRDARNAEGVEAVHSLVSRAALYATNGLQFLPFNTLYQLDVARRSPGFAAARRMLLMPDLFGFLLTGVQAAERTNASTTGLLDVRTGDWANDLIDALLLPRSLLPPLRDPGEPLGLLNAATVAQTGADGGVGVTLVGSHDTASAVAAVPAETEHFAYVSCGTWSLVGVELSAPVLSEESRLANFTNELGVDGRVRYLRNVMGLWLLQESMRTWVGAGTPEVLEAVLVGAAKVAPGGPVIDLDDPAFLPPGNMPQRIEEACRASGQPVPQTRAALVRCILDSLAHAYARAVSDAQRLSGHTVDVIHIVGGGSRNRLLCQLTSNVTGLPVLAGPVEATAIGNMLVQARSLGFVDGDLESLRALIRATHPLRRYQPHAS